MAKRTSDREALFRLKGPVPPGMAVSLALQHLVAMIVGCVTPAIIVAGAAGLELGDRVVLIQASLVMSAVSTFFQPYPIGGRFGSGLPVILGVSFAYVPSMQAIAAGGGIASIAGAMLVGGAVAVVVGLSMKRIRRLFPPVITGTVVFTIGLSLYPTAINYMAGGTGNTAEIIAAKGLLFAINSIQAIGDFTATTVGGLDREPTDRELKGGVIAYGVSNILTALFGGLPTATYSQNVGIVTTNKVVNRTVFAMTGGFLLLAGVCPKFAAVLTTIPQCVLGGATVTVFSTIAMIGMKLIASQELTARNTTIVGLSAALGVGISQASSALSQFPDAVTMIFGKSPVVIATIMAVLLNLLLPKESNAS